MSALAVSALLPRICPLVGIGHLRRGATGRGETNVRGALRQMQRQYDIWCFVKRFGQGIEDAGVQLTIELLDNFINKYTEAVNDESGRVLDYGEKSGFRVELDTSAELRDNGFSTLMRWGAGEQNYGFQLSVPVFVTWGPGLICPEDTI